MGEEQPHQTLLGKGGFMIDVDHLALAFRSVDFSFKNLLRAFILLRFAFLISGAVLRDCAAVFGSDE